MRNCEGEEGLPFFFSPDPRALSGRRNIVSFPLVLLTLHLVTVISPQAVTLVTSSVWNRTTGPKITEVGMSLWTVFTRETQWPAENT